jgi:hypothetical protein
MRLKAMVLALVLALVSAFTLAPIAVGAQGTNVLKNVPVTGTLEDGSTFRGKLTVTEFGYNEATGLWVSGFLKGNVSKSGEAGVTHVKQAFTQVDATLNEAAASAGGASNGMQALAVTPQQVSCDILTLDLGPLHLDLLGLVVDLSEIHLDITAVPGAGNLLGNLLCAVAGLLDPGGLLDELIGNLTDLLDLLTAINNLLG